MTFFISKPIFPIGYGEIISILAVFENSPNLPFIVKLIAPPTDVDVDDISHSRKTTSYRVEAAFYKQFSTRLSSNCRVATFFGSHSSDDAMCIVLEDLNEAGFDKRCSSPSSEQIFHCLNWLAEFHATFLNVEPTVRGKITFNVFFN